MNTLGPKKDGSPNIDFFQSPETLQGFESIRQWLQKNCKKVRANNNAAANKNGAVRRRKKKRFTHNRIYCSIWPTVRSPSRRSPWPNCSFTSCSMWKPSWARTQRIRRQPEFRLVLIVPVVGEGDRVPRVACVHVNINPPMAKCLDH